MSRGVWLALAGAFAGLAASIWLLAFRVDATQWRDGVWLRRLEDLQGTYAENVADRLVMLGDPIAFTLGLLGIVWFANRSGDLRKGLVLAVATILGAATGQLLKLLLEEERVHALIEPGDIASTGWPSGHAEAAMAIALGALIVAPPARRRLVGAIGITLAVAVGASLGIATWHYPSDALGGYAIAATWTCMALALLSGPASDRVATVAPRRRWPRATG